MSEWIIAIFVTIADVAVLHGSSSSEATYSTCKPDTAALPAVPPGSGVSAEYQSDGGLPSSHPGCEVSSEPATALQWSVHSCACIFCQYPSFTTDSVRILSHLTPECRRHPYPLPSVPGNLHGLELSGPSPGGLALVICRSHAKWSFAMFGLSTLRSRCPLSSPRC
jgi:hypothetical protein